MYEEVSSAGVTQLLLVDRQMAHLTYTGTVNHISKQVTVKSRGFLKAGGDP